MRSRKAFVLRLRRITIRRKEKNQTFNEEISEPGQRGQKILTRPSSQNSIQEYNERLFAEK